MMCQSSAQTFSSGRKKAMEPQLFGSCAYMITAQHKGHIKLHWPVIPGDLQHFKGIFTLLLKPKTMNPFFYGQAWNALCWLINLSVRPHMYLFVDSVVSLNKLCYTDEAQCSRVFPFHSCTVAPLTLICCNVLQDNTPLLWAIPTGAHLHKQLLYKRECVWSVKEAIWMCKYMIHIQNWAHIFTHFLLCSTRRN